MKSNSTQPSVAIDVFSLLLGMSAAALMLISPRHLAAQETIVSNLPACAACRIEINAVGRIGALEGNGAIGNTPRGVILDGQGRFWIVDDGDIPMVFGPEGNFLFTVGRRGSGPGEFQGPTAAIRLPGDSMLIFDVALRRASVFDPNARFARSIDMPTGQVWESALFNWPSTLVINALLQTPNEAGWPFDLLDMTGSPAVITKSFGTNDGVFRPAQRQELLKQLAFSRSGRLWTADIMRYELNQWNESGSHLRRMQRKPVWFSAESNLMSVGSKDSPPPPRMSTVHEDERGRIWVFTHVPKPSWREAWRNVPPLPDSPRGVPIEVPSGKYRPAAEALYRTMIDVIDAKSGRLVTSTAVNEFIIDVVSDGRLIAWSPAADGTPLLSVYRISLREP